jgi:hypothetical protein
MGAELGENRTSRKPPETLLVTRNEGVRGSSPASALTEWLELRRTTIARWLQRRRTTLLDS